MPAHASGGTVEVGAGGGVSVATGASLRADDAGSAVRVSAGAALEIYGEFGVGNGAFAALDGEATVNAGASVDATPGSRVAVGGTLTVLAAGDGEDGVAFSGAFELMIIARPVSTTIRMRPSASVFAAGS